jgi:hypothetical protein
MILFRVTRLRDVEEASGNSKVMYNRPSSSVGMKLVGFTLNKKYVPTTIHSSSISAYLLPLITFLTVLVYLCVTLSNHESK